MLMFGPPTHLARQDDVQPIHRTPVVYPSRVRRAAERAPSKGLKRVRRAFPVLERIGETRRVRVTQLLEAWRLGDSRAFHDLFPLVTRELEILADQYLDRDGWGDGVAHRSARPALVHCAYLRLVDQTSARLESQAWFFDAAAQAMRRILVAYARKNQNERRRAPYDKLFFGEFSGAGTCTSFLFNHSARVLEIHEALQCLHEIQPRLAKLTELRYFGGLTPLEAAEVLGVSMQKMERDWLVARLWLNRHLSFSD